MSRPQTIFFDLIPIPKIVFENYSCPQNSSLGPQKAKTTPKLSQNQISELKET